MRTTEEIETRESPRTCTLSTTSTPSAARGRRVAPAKRGFALLISLLAIAILAVLVTDLHETTGMSFSAATAERDQLKSEYLAKSGINLTRMLVAQERNLRALLAGPYQLLLRRPPPQLPIWKFANAILAPFANYDSSKEDMESVGVDTERTKGLGEVGGTFEITASAENGKVNVNDPRMQDITMSQKNVASILYSLLGGYLPSPNKYDPLFTSFDEKGRVTTRGDLVSNIIDWWDMDDQRVNYDPLLATVQSSGGEDTDYYRDQLVPYTIKNAPFDTLEELRLVRGMSDDVWATFVEPDLEDSTRRQLTIYGMSRVNPNEAEPDVMLARVCTFAEARQQLLCSDPTGQERRKFIMLLTMARSLANGVPWFSRASDFINFITGAPQSLYSMLEKALGGGGAGGGVGALLGGGGQAGAAGKSPFLFTPLQNLKPEVLAEMRRTFGTSGYLFTIDSVGRVGNSQRRIRAVINIDPKWTPPKPNAGRLPPLGVFAYYRLD